MSNIKFDGLDIADSLAASYYTALKICCQSPTFCRTYIDLLIQKYVNFFWWHVKKTIKVTKKPCFSNHLEQCFLTARTQVDVLDAAIVLFFMAIF